MRIEDIYRHPKRRGAAMMRQGYAATDFSSALDRQRSATDETIAMLEAQAKKSAAWLAQQRRDGVTSPAEKAVLNCLRALMAIPKPEREGSFDILMDHIARAYLVTAHDSAARVRRTTALLRIAAEETVGPA